VLGQDWQDEYYIWDCAAGTGNLLAGLTNKYRIWASTLDKQDVDVMHDRIENGANLLKKHVFQFDFLNDDFSKLPEELQNIINDPEKRKKLVIYINPPYVEAGSTRQRSGTGKNKVGVALQNKVYQRYAGEMGKASNELFAQFFMRIEKEMKGCFLAAFSKIKHLQAPNFKTFRKNFHATLEASFLVPSSTFDNVKGQFPIGFLIWNTKEVTAFKYVKADIFDEKGKYAGKKKIHSYSEDKPISCFTKNKPSQDELPIGHFAARGGDFQNQNAVFINNIEKKKTGGGVHVTVSKSNLLKVAISFSIRHAIRATWLNDRDQFLAPKKKWEKDTEFQNDCLTFMLFHGQNRISTEEGTNHWIPFTEQEVNAQAAFESNFMTRFIAGKIKLKGNGNLLETQKVRTTPLEFSPEAQAVFTAGKALWTYYHQQEDVNVNASLYDIRTHFQGRNAKGRMNSRSEDETYTKLIGYLRTALKVLGGKIAPKVYEYGFLKK
jgi:hypothetical protein